MFFRKLSYETGQPVSSVIEPHLPGVACDPSIVNRKTNAEDIQTLIEELFCKETDFMQLGLYYAKKARALHTRLFNRYTQYEPGIRREACRLLQFVLLSALRRTDNGGAEQRTVNYLLKYLYRTSLVEAEQTLPEYFAEPQTPGAVFARNVWDIIGARPEKKVFAAFTDQVCAMVSPLLDLFELTLQGFTTDPHGIFAAFIVATQWQEP